MMEPREHVPILIIEDEIFVAMDIERVLVDEGHKVVGIASDRAEALALADRCALALVDVNLRDGRTGPEIARELHRKSGVRTLFVTANPAQVGEGVDGAVGFVRKPFDDAMIRDAVRWALSGGHAQPDNDAVIPFSPPRYG
jgi:CheY-like chemotaxis protein